MTISPNLSTIPSNFLPNIESLPKKKEEHSPSVAVSKPPLEEAMRPKGLNSRVAELEAEVKQLKETNVKLEKVITAVLGAIQDISKGEKERSEQISTIKQANNNSLSAISAALTSVTMTATNVLAQTQSSQTEINEKVQEIHKKNAKIEKILQTLLLFILKKSAQDGTLSADDLSSKGVNVEVS